MGLELRMGRNDYVIFDFGSKMQKKKIYWKKNVPEEEQNFSQYRVVGIFYKI